MTPERLGLLWGITVFAGACARLFSSFTGFPSVVILLLSGLFIGRSGLGLVEPLDLGQGLETIVGLLVCLVLFEGGLNLKLPEGNIRNTVLKISLVRLFISLSAGIFIAHWLAGLSWQVAGIYSAIVLATGPTVVSPLVEQIKLASPLSEVLKAENKALRIGVNHGSLSERMLFTYGDTPLGMTESAMEFVKICDELDFHNIIISMKASRAPVMMAAYRMIADRLDSEGYNYPLHLGVTEAGDGDYGRIKSTAGIGTLLAEGLGDTIRVSLTEAPEKEIPVCYSILQSLGLRKTMVEYISCPSCGRTLFNLEEVVDKVRKATSHLTGLDIAIMGCIVNGPGEMADADYGYVGKGKGTIALYRRKEEIKRVPEDEGVNALIQLIKDDGKWIDP